MTGRIQLLTGHPEAVQRLVDEDLAATRQGPHALDTALEGRPAEQVTACYRALLDRAWQDHVAASRDALRRAALADAATDHTGGRR